MTKRSSADTDKIISEHRADPGAAVRGLTQLLLCAASLAAPIADHSADPRWCALVTDLGGMLARLDAMDVGPAVAAPSSKRTRAAWALRGPGPRALDDVPPR